MEVKLTGEDRAKLKKTVQTAKDATKRIHAHIVLLLADGHDEPLVQKVTYCTAEEFADAVRLFRENGVRALL